MLPEISRRCLKCGAAVRAGARFCPQCGQEFIEAGQMQTPDVASARDVAATTREAYVPVREDESGARLGGVDERGAGGLRGVDESGAVGAGPSSRGEGVADAAIRQAIEGDDGARAREERSRVARVRETARVRVEHTKARAAKMRDEALVVLEETPDDSGLRFVLVAVAVFLLFLIFLFFSTSVLR